MRVKISIYSLSVLLTVFLGVSGSSHGTENPSAVGKKTVAFNEVWAYLMAGEEGKVTGIEPFTDVCYFSAAIDYRGKLAGQKKVPVVFAGKTTRVHLVIAELSNPALMHFCLNPGYGLRSSLIRDIVDAAADYHGVQLDFESVPSAEKDAFIGFVRELRSALGGKKILSLAVPPRRVSVDDAYDYAALAAVSDRIIVMAYDQHWSASSPGAVASLWWCRDVTAYAKSRVGADKLIMGIPLFARAWQDKKLARALTMNGLEEIKKNRSPEVQVCDRNGPYFTYREDVTVTVYFDDLDSIMQKMKLYSGERIKGISFWRIGQGSPDLWPYIDISAASFPDK